MTSKDLNLMAANLDLLKRMQAKGCIRAIGEAISAPVRWNYAILLSLINAAGIGARYGESDSEK
jgi:hypothetical protein